MRRTIFAAVAIAVLPAVSWAQDDTRWSWTGDVETGKWLRVVSINGPIHVEPSTNGRVQITAEKRWTRGDPRQVRFEVVQRDGNVTVCAIWHDNQECTESGMRSRGGRQRNTRNDVAVHFRVRLPSHAHVAPTTVNGEIKVTGARGEIRATTVNGAIELATSGGPASATTVNGGITAVVGAPGDGDLNFTTVNGTVDVAVPRSISADVRMSTVNGDIRTDFPLNVQGRWGPRTASGTLGGGDGEVKITAVNGSLVLRAR